jgi:putative tryptophan/tyrosine transport system substrate-binding protein
MGLLMPYAMSNAEAQASSNALLHGLRELGWIEGRNLEVEYRFAGAGTEDLRSKALELAALQIDVIIARATPAVIALATATKKIPIVFTVVNDPVGSGFVESWARPGGNITGFANFQPSIAGKWLEVLKEIAPDVTRVAILFNPETAPGHGSTFIDPLDQAAPSLGLKLVHAPVQEDRAIEDVGAKLAREQNLGAAHREGERAHCRALHEGAPFNVVHGLLPGARLGRSCHRQQWPCAVRRAKKTEETGDGRCLLE